MKNLDILKLLSRTDKWYLGGGNRLLWAPRFPLHPDTPGFWDEASYHNYDLQPLFTWTLLDEAEYPISLAPGESRWNPAVLKRPSRTNFAGVSLTEERSLLPNDVALAVLRIRNRSRRTRRIHLILWTVLEQAPPNGASFVDEMEYRKGTLSFRRTVHPSGRPPLHVHCALGMSANVISHAAQLSEGLVSRPDWRSTPFAESFAKSGLPNVMNATGVSNEGFIYAALQTRLQIRPGLEESVALALAAAPSQVEAKLNLQAALRQREPLALSVLNWQDHFFSVPSFVCSDEYFTRAYWYRWYGLRLNTIFGGDGNYNGPAVCEGIGPFRGPIAYSAPCHMLENRWMHEPDLARGILQTFLEHQQDDGCFRGYIDPFGERRVEVGGNLVEPFYHANWGNALRQLDLVHRSSEFLESTYDGLKKYASYFDRERDQEVSGLYDVVNHYETGQEYMRRYLAVNPQADQQHWGEVFRLKGVDATVYMYELKCMLGTMADRLGKQGEAELWSVEAGKIREAVRTRMWDPDEQMFFDVDPRSGERTGVKAAVCFYPYFTDIVDASHVKGLKRHLLNPREFWTPYPVPSSSADDPLFQPEPLWKGKRMNCPWNGRVWPMTNSHVAEALAVSAIRFQDPVLRRKTVEFMRKYIRMMFTEGDSTRPNSFEHYHPFKGTPSAYRGIDDYQHSWIVDLIIKYVCGIRPEEFAVTIDPFPFGLKHVAIDRVCVRERELRVEITGRRFVVTVDGALRVESTLGRPVQLQI